ncbi:hypothetical protein [Aliarcobacter skirrowii]|uniref:hypothetical protein n=1 Tax=Aliarcobacter skirrowii TaxID=28200 RepID=UPI0029BDEE70|nr:hypothetical protein [Aliarcobacter skirrowii]MDX4028411.1 hypothetical protein [Aliarcobacter skirrowii]
MKLKKILLINLISISFLFGSEKTYQIIEKDLIQEIEEKVPYIIERMEQDKKEIVKKIENMTGEKLTKATVNHTKYIDPTYTVNKDIPKYDRFGKKQGVLYPKGYKFNPIEFMKVTPPDLIVFNVCDEFENKYVEKLVKDEYEANMKDYMLVNSGCENEKVRKSNFKGKVYFLTQEMVQKFQLKHTISIIFIDKELKKIAVKEIANDKKDN